MLVTFGDIKDAFAFPFFIIILICVFFNKVKLTKILTIFLCINGFLFDGLCTIYLLITSKSIRTKLYSDSEKSEFLLFYFIYIILLIISVFILTK